MVELWLQSNTDNVWYSLDTGSDVSISINKTFEDIEDFTTRISTYSKTFQIPFSQRNNKFFQSVYNVNGSNFDESVVVNAVVKYAGADVFVGESRLVRVGIAFNGGYYEIFLTQTLPDFANTIQDRKLTDLPFSGLTHELDYDTLVSTWAYTGGSYNDYAGIVGKIVYPLGFYGYDDNEYYGQFIPGASGFTNSNYPLSLSQFAPWVNTKYLIDQIFDFAGFTYTSSFFESDYFKGIFALAKTQNVMGAFQASGATENQNIFSVKDSRTYIDLPDGNFDTLYFKGFIFRNELNDPLNIFSPSISFQNRGHFFTTAVAGTYKFKFGFNISVRYSYLPATYLNIAIKDVDDGTIYNQIQGITIFNLSQPTIVGDVYLNATIPAGRRVALYYSRQSTGGDPYAELYFNSAYWELYSSPIIAASKEVLLQNNLPNEITCLDFFKGIVSMFNLVVIPNGERNLLIEKWDTYFSGGIERDWSLKLDLSKGYTLAPTNSLKKEYIVKYEDSEDYLSFINQQNRNQQYGTFRYISPTAYHSGNETITIPFQPLPISTFDNATDSNILIPHLYWFNTSKEDVADDPSPANIYQTRGSNIRLGFYNGLLDSKITGTTTPYYILSASTAVSHTTYPAISHLSSYEYSASTFSDLNIGNQYDYWQNWNDSYVGYTINDVFNDFWASRLDPLYSDDTKIFTGTFKLTPTEINDIKFNDRVWFQNAWWRLLDMSDADITNVNLVECDFLKLPYDIVDEDLIPPTYQQAPEPSAPPTPTGSTYNYLLFTSVNLLDLCSETAPQVSVYSNCGILSAGCNVYYDTLATNPVQEGILLKESGQSTIYQVAENGLLQNFTTC